MRALILFLAGLLVGAALAVSYTKITSLRPASRTMGEVQSGFPEEILVMRTKGGLLEVSTVQVKETLETRFSYTILGIPVGETVPRIRVPAVYRYHIELAPEWKVLRTADTFTVIAPPLKPSLPVAVDFRHMEKDVSGSWVLVPFTSTEDLEDLERSITERLARNAVSPVRVGAQKDEARKTVAEFVSKWLVTQTQFKAVAPTSVRVLFSDEPIGSLDPQVFPLNPPPRPDRIAP
jgi:hypothetical protein